jgi:hypothetical protein
MELMRSLWRATDAVLGPADPGWPERSGAYSIEGAGVQLYGGILLKQSPLEFLTQRVSLFRLFYQPGNMEVVEIEPAAPSCASSASTPATPPSAAARRAASSAPWSWRAARSPSVRHVRCSVEGDAFCEWELRWE